MIEAAQKVRKAKARLQQTSQQQKSVSKGKKA